MSNLEWSFPRECQSKFTVIGVEDELGSLEYVLDIPVLIIDSYSRLC
jgi:hypothetical protein